MANPFEAIEYRLKDIESRLLFIISNLPEINKSKEIDTIGIDEAARILNLSKQTVYTKTHKKIIPHSKQGKILLFSRKRLAEYIALGEVKTYAEELSNAENFRVEKLSRKSA